MAFSSPIFLLLKFRLKKITTLFLGLIALLGITSCAYNFSEDYYVDIEIPDANSTIDLVMFGEDPVLFQPTTISYQYNGQDNQELRQVAVYIDDNLVNYFHDSSDQFPINTDNLSEGEHILKIVYTFSSGSGSLADINNGETYTKTEEFRFTVNKSPPEDVVLTKVEVVDGSIFVFWNPISNSNYSEAILRVQNPESNRVIEDIVLSVEDMDSGSFNDRSNTAFQLDYSIILINRYSESTSNKLNLSLPTPSLRGKIISNSQYNIVWEEHPLYGNFDYYSYNVRPNNTFVELSNRGGEYLVNDSPQFAQKEYHSLNLERRDSFDNLHHVSERIHFGKIFDTTLKIKYLFSVTHNAYYVLEYIGRPPNRQTLIHTLDPDNLALIRSDDISSFGGGTIVLDPITQNILLDAGNATYMLDPNDMSVINSWNASEYSSDPDIYATSYRNGIFLLRSSSSGASFYNASTKQFIYNAPTISSRFKFADDGRYFYNNEGIYSIINGSVSLATTTYEEKPIFDIVFLNNKNVCIYNEVHQNPVIYDFDTNSKQVLTNFSTVNAIGHDPTTDKLFMYRHIHQPDNSSYVHIYDMTSGETKALEVYDSSHSSYVDYLFLNGKLISTEGFYLTDYFN